MSQAGATGNTTGGTTPVPGGGTGKTSFTPYAVITGGTTSTGALQNVVGVGTAGQVLTSNGASALPSWQAGGGGGGGITTIDGDSGSVTGSTVTIYSDTAALNCGSTVNFANSGTTSKLNVTDGNLNTIIGNGSGIASLSGYYNTCVGKACFTTLTSGQGNVALGTNAGRILTTASFNICIGGASLYNLDSGQRNCCFGQNSGFNYTSTESDNICIGYGAGTVGDSNTLRIGVGEGTGTGELNKAFICGIRGNTTGSPEFVTIDSVTGQLGTSAGGGGGLVLISSQTISSPVSSIAFTGITGYRYYQVQINDLNLSATGAVYLEYSSDNGATYDTNPNYLTIGYCGFSNGPAVFADTNTFFTIHRNLPSGSTVPFSTTTNFYGFDQAAINYSSIIQSCSFYSGISQGQELYNLYYNNTVVINAIKYLPASGNFTGGTFKLYGVT